MIAAFTYPVSPVPSLPSARTERSHRPGFGTPLQNSRALGRSGPFRTLTLEKVQGDNSKAKPLPVCHSVPPTDGRPRPKIRKIHAPSWTM